jgi:hypothetical protein
MKPITMILALGGILAAGTAHADQCEWIGDGDAAKAAALLAKQPKVIEMCEPCGDKAPGEPFVARTVEITRPSPRDGDYRTVVINGHAVDLAYTYVKTSDDYYENLARLVGCPAEGVSPSLHIEAETPTGVMIAVSDHAPPAAPAPVENVEPPAPPAEAIVVAAPPSPPQMIVYSTTYTQSISWLAVAIAGIGGFFAGGMVMLGAVAVRRRRAMRPRASDLPLR